MYLVCLYSESNSIDLAELDKKLWLPAAVWKRRETWLHLSVNSYNQLQIKLGGRNYEAEMTDL